MRKHFEIRTILGLLIWIGIISGGILLARNSLHVAPDAMSQIARYVGTQRHTVQLEMPFNLVVRVGDPVFLAGNDQYSPIGYVSQVQSKESTSKIPTYTDVAFITFYGSAPPIETSDYLDYHYAPDSTAWVLKTMLPPAKREQIGKLIMNAYSDNQSEIVAAMRPIIKDSFKQASQIIKEDLETAFAAREDQIRKIGRRYQSEIIEKELIPLIEQEIWPIVQEESEPLASQIGQEIWQEVSVFRFGWRYIYDRSPLPEKKLAEGEFTRFLEDKAIPILKSHLGEFVDIQQSIVKRISENEEVRKTFSSSMQKIMNDEEVRQIFTEVFQEVFVGNQRLQKSMEDHWNSPDAKNAVSRASGMLEPTVAEIGVALFGSPKSSITPEFARTLRHRILHKDDRWFTLHIADNNAQPNDRAAFPETIPVRIAEPLGEIPYAPARDRN